jgi:RNA 2',3'-cyclic 3'-phosphodiesterase
MSRGATARLFAALDPPAEVGEQLAAWARAVAAGWGSGTARRPQRPVRVLDASSLHLTICFLGARPVAEIEPLAAALGSCTARVGELSVGAPLRLPPRRPRALAVEIHDRDGELARLQRDVSDALAGASSWEPEQRRFRAHITLARMLADTTTVRERRSAGEPPLLPPTPQLRFTPGSIILYRSWLDPAGATYEALATCDLPSAGAGDPLAAHSEASSPDMPDSPDSPDSFEATEATSQASAEPSPATTGVDPSGQPGSELSSHSKDPPPGTGAVPSSQTAGVCPSLSSSVEAPGAFGALF